jgi:AcrR family transcriptional regulator
MRRTVSQIQSPSSSHDRMLSSALSLIAQQGYVHTSTAQVARAAGTSESQLIKHFGSKEGLLEALFESVWSELNTEVGRLARRHSDPVNRLKALVALMLTRIAANDEVRRLMLFEGRRIRSRGLAVSKGFVRFVESLDAVLKEANRAGRFRVGVAPTAIRSLLMGACEGLLRDRQLAADATYPAAYSRKDISRAIDALIGTFLTDSTSPPTRRRSSSRGRSVSSGPPSRPARQKGHAA